MIEDFEYLSNLYTVRYRDGYGDYLYLAEPFSVKFKMDGVEKVIICPNGMPSDGPSVPNFVPNWIVDRLDKHLEASIVHDYLCYQREASGYSSQEAAAVFKAGMDKAGVKPWLSWAMYQAVLRFGPQWDKL